MLFRHIFTTYSVCTSGLSLPREKKGQKSPIVYSQESNCSVSTSPHYPFPPFEVIYLNDALF